MPEDRINELSSLSVAIPICLITNGVPSNSERNIDNRISNIILFDFNNKIPECSKSVILENFRKLHEDVRRYLGKYHKRLPKEFGLIKPIKTCHVCGHSETSHRSKEGERWCSECNYYCHSPY